jgi:cytidine deaminase
VNTINTNIVIKECSFSELEIKEQELLTKAKTIAQKAYAPYSKFFVGSAILMQNGEIVLGNNQENAAYPSGICAERTAIFSASALFPNSAINTIAIYAQTSEFVIKQPVYPCGACRQSIIEYEHKFKQPIKLLLMGQDSKVHLVESMSSILPFSFTSDSLFNV